MSSPTAVEDRIEAFLRTQFSICPSDSEFGWNVDIFQRGYVDSVGAIELIAFLGGEFDVEVPDEDLLSEEFSTVVGIARIVRRLRDGDHAASTTRRRESEGPGAPCLERDA